MAWQECTKDEYWQKIHSANHHVRAERDETTWSTPNGTPVAKSSKGYRPINGQEQFFIWIKGQF